MTRRPGKDVVLPATAGTRCVGALVDLSIALAVSTPLVVCLAVLVLTPRASTAVFVVLVIGSVLVLLRLLILAGTVGSRGRTPGTVVTRCRVVRADTGRPMGFARALGRGLIVDLLCVPVLISVLLDRGRRGQGLHDQAVGALVVDIAAGADPMAPAPPAPRPAASDYMATGPVHVVAPPAARGVRGHVL